MNNEYTGLNAPANEKSITSRNMIAEILSREYDDECERISEECANLKNMNLVQMKYRVPSKYEIITDLTNVPNGQYVCVPYELGEPFNYNGAAKTPPCSAQSIHFHLYNEDGTYVCTHMHTTLYNCDKKYFTGKLRLQALSAMHVSSEEEIPQIFGSVAVVARLTHNGPTYANLTEFRSKEITSYISGQTPEPDYGEWFTKLSLDEQKAIYKQFHPEARKDYTETSHSSNAPESCSATSSVTETFHSTANVNSLPTHPTEQWTPTCNPSGETQESTKNDDDLAGCDIYGADGSVQRAGAVIDDEGISELNLFGDPEGKAAPVAPTSAVTSYTDPNHMPLEHPGVGYSWTWDELSQAWIREYDDLPF